MLRTAPLRVRAFLLLTALCGTASALLGPVRGAQAPVAAPGLSDAKVIAAADCTAARLGATIPVEKIGEPVRRITLAEPQWTAETATTPAYCRVTGVMDPVDTSATARPINFAVALPAA